MFMNSSTTSHRPVPGPSGLQLLSHLPRLRRDLLSMLLRYQRDYGDILRFSVGTNTVYFLCHPAMAERVLIQDLETFGSLSQQSKKIGLALILGNGLLQSYGEEWKRQRQRLQPWFHKRRVAGLATEMTAAGEHLLQHWQRTYRPGEVIDVLQEMITVALDIVCRTLFSADVTPHLDTLRKTVPVLVDYAVATLKNPFSLPLSWPTPRNLQFKRALQTVDEVIYQLIHQRQARREPSEDMLGLLVQAREEVTGEPMTLLQIRDQVATMLGVGHETTATAMTWLWYALDQHPQVLQQVQSELATVLAGRTPTVADLPNLTYTRQVIEEVLRHYTPVPLVARLVLQDTEINGYPLPAGRTVFVSFHNIHHHPEFWTEADQFRPERFAVKDSGTQHRCAYLPFGVGPRICLGNHFALLEMQLLLAQIAQHYTLQLVPNHVLEREVTITVRPRHGLPMRLSPRSV